MRKLRRHWGFTQENLISKNRSQVSGVESGANLLSGPLLQQYADAFGVHPKDIAAYRAGSLSLEQVVKLSAKPPRPGAITPQRGRSKKSASHEAAPADTKAASDLAAEWLHYKLGWSLTRAYARMGTVHLSDNHTVDGYKSAALAADYLAGGDAGWAQTVAEEVEMAVASGQGGSVGRRAAPKSLPPSAKATAARELGKPPQER